MGLLSPPQGPTETEKQAGQWAEEIGQADAVCRAALRPRPVPAIEEIGVVESLGTVMGTPEQGQSGLCSQPFLVEPLTPP